MAKSNRLLNHLLPQTVAFPLNAEPVTWFGPALLTLTGAASVSSIVQTRGGSVLFAPASTLGATYTGILNTSTTGTLELASSTATTFTGVNAGAGTVILSGSAPATFLADNTWSGTVRVKSGATFTCGTGLVINTNDPYGSAAFIIESGGAIDTAGAQKGTTQCPGLTWNNGAIYSNSGVVGGIMPSPCSILGTLNIVNNQVGSVFQGVVTGAPGTLILWDASSPGAGLLFSNPANAFQGDLHIQGAGAFQCATGGTINGATWAGNATLDTTGFLSHGSTVSQTWRGVISGAGQLKKSGSGTASTLTITGQNTFTGGTQITAGTLQPNATGGSTNGLGTGAVLVMGSTAILDVAGQGDITAGGTVSIPTVTLGGGSSAGQIRNSADISSTVRYPILLSGTGTVTLALTSASTATTTTYLSNLAIPNGTMTLALNSGTVSTLGTLRFNGVISGAGTLTTAGGSGTILLAGANLFTGIFGIINALVKAGLASVFDSSLNQLSGPFGVNARISTGTQTGKGLSLNGFDVGVGSLVGGSATGGSVVLGSNTLTIAGTAAPTPPSYAGVISGTGGIRKATTGKQTLTGASTYTGVTTFAGGTILAPTIANAGTASSIGAAAVAATNLVFNGGNLRHTGAAATTNKAFTVQSGGGTIEASGTGILTWSGAPTFSAGSGALTLEGTAAFVNVFSGIIGGGANGSLVKNGTTTWALSAANTYAGNTTINAGVLLMNAAMGATATTVNATATFGGTGTLAAGSSVTLNGGALMGGTGTGNTGTMTLNGGFTNTGGSITVNTNGTTAVSTISRPAGATVTTLNGLIVNFGAGQNLNAGTYTLWTLGAASSFSGTPTAGTVPANRTSMTFSTTGTQLSVTVS